MDPEVHITQRKKIHTRGTCDQKPFGEESQAPQSWLSIKKHGLRSVQKSSTFPKAASRIAKRPFSRIHWASTDNLSRLFLLLVMRMWSQNGLDKNKLGILREKEEGLGEGVGHHGYKNMLRDGRTIETDLDWGLRLTYFSTARLVHDAADLAKREWCRCPIGQGTHESSEYMLGVA